MFQSSQTDKKEDFRKYLEKANVLVLLTTILTDLYEMVCSGSCSGHLQPSSHIRLVTLIIDHHFIPLDIDNFSSVSLLCRFFLLQENKPDDPCQYIYQRFGEALKTSDTAAAAAQPDSTVPSIATEPSGKDVNMSDMPAAVPAKRQDPTTTVTSGAPQTAAPTSTVQQPIAPSVPTMANHGSGPAEAASSEPALPSAPVQGVNTNMPSVPLADGQPAAAPGNTVVPPGTGVQQPPGSVPQVNTQAASTSAQ